MVTACNRPLLPCLSIVSIPSFHALRGATLIYAHLMFTHFETGVGGFQLHERDEERDDERKA